MLFGDEELAAHLTGLEEVFKLLEDVNMSLEMKLTRGAAMLKCTPTTAGIGDALSIGGCFIAAATTLTNSCVGMCVVCVLLPQKRSRISTNTWWRNIVERENRPGR